MDWKEILVWAIPVVIVPLALFGVKWLQHKARAMREDAETKKLEGKDLLKNQVLGSLAMVAANIANSELKKLKEVASDGEVSKDDLKRLGSHAINTVKEEFKASGKDLAKEFGPTFLQEGLRFVVDKFNKEEEAPAEPKKATKK